MKTQEEIEQYFTRCEFDDECDVCKNPEGGSYAAGYTNDECGCEVDHYICGKCASLSIDKIKALANEEKNSEHV